MSPAASTWVLRAQAAQLRRSFVARGTNLPGPANGPDSARVERRDHGGSAAHVGSDPGSRSRGASSPARIFPEALCAYRPVHPPFRRAFSLGRLMTCRARAQHEPFVPPHQTCCANQRGTWVHAQGCTRRATCCGSARKASRCGRVHRPRPAHGCAVTSANSVCPLMPPCWGAGSAPAQSSEFVARAHPNAAPLA